MSSYFGASQVNSFLSDCRFAWRLFLRTPSASLVAIVALAIAVAFVTSFFSLYAGLSLRAQAGFERAWNIATIGQSTGTALFGLPYSIVETLPEEMSTIEAAAVVGTGPALVGREREEVVAALVSEEFFPGLRPHVSLGRGLQSSDFASPSEPVAVLSFDYWQRKFAGDPGILGTYIDVMRLPNSLYLRPPAGAAAPAEPSQDPVGFQIVGIMAKSLPGIPSSQFASPNTAIWLPLDRAWPLLVGAPESLPGATVPAFIRRAAGAPASAVRNELRARFESPESSLRPFPGARLDVIDGIVSNIAVARETRRQLWMFISGSVLLAFVAAINVSLYLSSRVPNRNSELGIRMASGAPVKRLARQLATEAWLLVAISAAMGLLLSFWATSFLRGLTFFERADWRDAPMLDWRMVAVSTLFLLMLAAAVSLLPVLRLKRVGIAASARWTTARASLAQRLAGSFQLAAAGAIGAAAIAFAWHLSMLLLGDPGYETSDRYVVEGVARPTNGMEGGYLVELQRRREAIEAIPGVRQVAFGTPVPGRPLRQTPVPVPQSLNPLNTIEVYVGSFENRFVELLGFKLLSGRMFEQDEMAGVVLVNESLARAIWGRDDVVGERLPGSGPWGREGAEIVGVIADVLFEHPSSEPKPFVFLPLNSTGVGIVDAALTAAELRQALDRLVSGGDLETQVDDVRSLKALRSDMIGPDRERGFLTIVSAILLISITTLGCYGIQRHLATLTRREYAIRAALGAPPRSIFLLAMLRSLLFGLPGIAVAGLLAAIAVAWLKDHFVSSEVSLLLTTILVVVGLALLVLAASFRSAQEAMHTRPGVNYCL